MSGRFFFTACLTFSLVLTNPLTLNAQRPAPRNHAQPSAARAGAPSAANAYKGIFEPVNYGQDINLTDVFFVSPEIGWVSGEHATILKTTDGGAHWAAQVGGDPNGNEKPIRQLRFLDARHGWAVTDDERLLRTMDGENWEQIGQQPAPGSGFIDYAFSSVRHGIALGGNMGGFFVTNDGGRHWQNVGPCQITVRIQGLAQTQDCWFIKLQMLSAHSALAFTHWRSPEAPNATSLAIFRTDNGGQSWTYVVPPFHDGGELDIFFTDLNHGVVVFDTRTYITDDGGRNFHALLSGGAATLNSHVRFADPEVGWSLGNKYPSLALSYTTSGGRHWNTLAPFRLPGDPDAKQLSLSFPRRDRAYIVGPHGMICRYSIVPATYTAANAFDGPLMPSFGGAELSSKADAIRRDIDRLRTKLASVGGPAATGPSSGIATSSTYGASTAATDQGAGAPIANNGATPVSDSGTAAPLAIADQSTNAPSIEQTAAAVATGDAGQAGAGTSAPDAAPTMTGASGQSGFVQDTSAPSASLVSCCAADLQQLQTDTATFATQAPQVATQLRPLNLIIAGLQLTATLLNQGHSLWNQFKTFKHAPTTQAAMQALEQLSTTLTTVQQASSSGFQSPGTWFAANAPATFTQDAGAATSSAGVVVGNAISGTAQPQSGVAPAGGQGQNSNGNPQQNPAQNTVDQTLDNAKQKLKNKLKWPH